MPKDATATTPPNEQTTEMRAWGSMSGVADDALAALEAGNVKQVSEHLEVIRDVATKKAGHMRTWTKMVRLAEDALGAINAGNKNMVREYLVAIRAVAQCAQET